MITPKRGGDGDGSWVLGHGSQGLFELFATALADNPAGLDQLERLVERLMATDTGREALPEGFDELCSSVIEARQRLGHHDEFV